MKNRIPTTLACAITLLCLCPDNVSWAQGTAFTYQGRLHTDGAPANDTNDFTFTLFLTDTGGAPVAGPVAIENLPVADGLFTTPVDFGMGVLTGAVHWLEIGVRPGASPGAYTTLSPRQKLTPAPYAVYAPNAGTATLATSAAGVASGAITTDALQDGAVTSAKVADGTIQATDLDATLLTGTFWRRDGNSGTTPRMHFLGTTDNQPLELKVNGQRALRIEPDVETPNILGGAAANSITPGIKGATIAGGGLPLYPNQINGNFATIGGGTFNFASGDWATISGGRDNRNYAESSTVGGGWANGIGTNADFSTIGGGYLNDIGTNSPYSTIGGGENNDIGTNSLASTIGGGYRNDIGTDSYYSTIAGGGKNHIGTYSSSSTIGGGYDNDIGTNSPYSTIGGGENNHIGTNSWASTIGGGYGNDIGTNSYSSTIGGGENNHIGTNSLASTIGGGYRNDIGTDSYYSTIAGGGKNHIGTYSSSSTIGGGSGNRILNDSAFATIPGGRSNTVAANYTFAAGADAKANHTGSFVWADSSGGDFATTGDNQFLIRASGFVGINKNTPATALDVNGIVTATSFSGTGGDLTGLNASALVSGTLPSARLAGTYSSALTFNNPANNLSGNGSALTALNASQLTSGTVPDVRLTSNVARRDQANTFTSQQIITNTSSGLAGAALRITPASASAIGLYVFQTSSDAAVVFENRGSGQQIVAFNAPGNEVFIVDNDGDVFAKSFAPISDRNRKENIAPVNPSEVLEKVAALPISRWNFKEDHVKHVGPMAQDFHAAFGLGHDDKHIATVDADGVALAAIQGLNQKLEAELKEKDARIADLETRLVHLEKLVSKPANLR
ncbi:MAG TPA: tail fiber domain-containing protein [Verrucomicrobiota bacterium]|nr:tail fiber domain-containing protein [Verrucomicrobiota bacterium]